jgi:hypothetical protein
MRITQDLKDYIYFFLSISHFTESHIHKERQNKTNDPNPIPIEEFSRVPVASLIITPRIIHAPINREPVMIQTPLLLPRTGACHCYPITLADFQSTKLNQLLCALLYYCLMLVKRLTH